MTNRSGITRSFNGVDWSLFAIACGVVVTILVNLTADTAHLVQRYTGDDSYFYLVIARNAAQGVFSSFDGVHFTNGYHPLWIVPLTLLATVAEGDRAFLIASVLLGIALTVLTIYLTVRRVQRVHPDPSVTHLVIGTGLFFLLLPSWYCMESPLAAVIAIAAIGYTIDHMRDARPAQNVILGLLLGAMVLARLDTVFIVGPLWFARLTLIDRRDRRQLIGFGVATAVTAVLVLAYVVSNYIFTGHLVPISGAIKSSFPVPTRTNMPLSIGRLIRIVPAILSAVLVVILLWRNRTRGGLSREAGTVLLACNAGVLLFGVYEFMFLKNAAWGLRPWHFAVPNAVMALSLGMVLFPMVPRSVRYVGAAVALVVCSAAGWQKYSTRTVREPISLDVYQTALWIRDNIPEDARIAVTDPGAIAYYGGRTTLNLDGLVNNYAFQQVIADGRLESYLDENNVQYAAVLGRGYSVADDTHRVRIEGQLHDTDDFLEFRSEDVIYTSPRRHYVIWKR